MSKSKNSFASLSKKDKVDFYISLVVILFTGMLIFAFTFPAANSMEKHNENSLLTENTMNISSLTINSKTYKPLEKPFKTRAFIEAPAEIGNIEAKPILTSPRNEFINEVAINEEDSDVLNDTENIENDENDSEGQIDGDETSDSIVTKVENSKIIEVDDKVEVEAEEIKEPSNETDALKSCIIIIGAFKKEANKEKLLDGLKSDGYTIFSAPYKGATRIGIYQPCNSETISATLKSVRSKYAKDAMILVEE